MEPSLRLPLCEQNYPKLAVQFTRNCKSKDAIIHSMPFPRAVIFEACNFLGSAVGYHGEFEDLVLRWEFDHLEARNGQAVHQRFRNLFRYLRDNPDARHDGRLLTDLVVEEAARCVGPDREGPEFVRALDRAGYMIEEGQLRRTLPEAIDLPAADDEVQALLNRYNLATPHGHLEQAVTAHGRGDWAAANSQVRSFLESLLDEITYGVASRTPLPPAARHVTRRTAMSVQIAPGADDGHNGL